MIWSNIDLPVKVISNKYCFKFCNSYFETIFILHNFFLIVHSPYLIILLGVYIHEIHPSANSIYDIQYNILILYVRYDMTWIFSPEAHRFFGTGKRLLSILFLINNNNTGTNNTVTVSKNNKSIRYRSRTYYKIK